MRDDPTPTPDTEDSKSPDSKKEKKMARNTSKVRSGKTRTAKKTGGKASKARSGATRSRLDPTAKVVKTNKGNPFKEGSGSYDRTELVLKNSGKTVEHISGLKGLKSSTISTLKRMGVVKVG